MKKYQYEQYDYAFLYGFLTEKQKEEVQSILDSFVGCPNTEVTRNAVEFALNKWFYENNINIKGKFKLKINYE